MVEPMRSDHAAARSVLRGPGRSCGLTLGRVGGLEATSALPSGDSAETPSDPATGAIGTALSLREHAAPPSPAAILVVPTGLGGETSQATELSALASLINGAFREANEATLEALGRYRLAGELLLGVKARVGHGSFKAWVKENCEFEYRSAASYMRISDRWEEVESLGSSKVQRVAPLSLREVIAALSKPKVRPAPVARRPARDEADRVELEAVRAIANNVIASLPSGRLEVAPIGVSPTPLETAGLAPREVAPPSTSGDPIRPGSRDVSATLPLPVAVPSADVPIAVAINRGGSSRLDDLRFLAALGPTRARLKQLGNHRDFEADAMSCRLLRPVADEILARGPDGDKDAGLYAALLADLVRAKSPEWWILCPGCGGSGHVEPFGNHCQRCSAPVIGSKFDGLARSPNRLCRRLRPRESEPIPEGSTVARRAGVAVRMTGSPRRSATGRIGSGVGARAYPAPKSIVAICRPSRPLIFIALPLMRVSRFSAIASPPPPLTASAYGPCPGPWRVGGGPSLTSSPLASTMPAPDGHLFGEHTPERF